MKKYTKVLILGGNKDQLPYIKEINRRGYKIFLTDLNPNAPGINYANHFLNIGYDQTDKIFQFAKKNGFNSNDYIFTASAQFSHVTAAIIAKKLKIKYPNPSIIKMCIDKLKYYLEFNKFKLPVPIYYKIKNKSELSKKLKLKKNINKFFYLKSDRSKNPKYVYRINSDTFKNINIFWGKDKFLNKYYILQREFIGNHYRINLFEKKLMIFKFFCSKKIQFENSCFVKHPIIKKLQFFVKKKGLSNWLVKFDVIENNGECVVIDIGLDPPFRMKKYFDNCGGNFVYSYIDQYLDNKISYKKSLL